MKNKMGIIVSLILIILFAIYIDYDYAKRKKQLPKLVIKNKSKYVGFLYKVFKCDDYISFANYSVKKVKCNNKIKDVYINKQGVKIEKEKYKMIFNLFSDEIDNFKNDKEVKNAYFLSKKYNEKTFKVIDGSAFINNDKTYSLVNFYKWDKEKWIIDDKEYCMTLENNKFKIYNYKNNKCEDEINIEPTKKFCNIVKENKNLQKDFLMKFCK